MNKRRQRTEQIRQAVARRLMAEQADNAIEQCRFNRLVSAGVIVSEKKRLLQAKTGYGGRVGFRGRR